MHPIEMMQCPLIVEQAPHLAPLLAGQLRRGVTELRLCPLTITQTSLGPKQRQGCRDPMGSGFGLDGILEYLLRLLPGPPCLLSHPTGISPSLFALGHFGIGLRCGLQVTFGLPPLALQDTLEFMLGMKYVESHLDRHRRGSLLALDCSRPRLVDQLHAPFQARACIRNDTLNTWPMG
jgi:hypothetical protein